MVDLDQYHAEKVAKLPPALKGELHRRLEYSKELLAEALEVGRLEALEARRRVLRINQWERVGVGILLASVPTAIMGFLLGIFTSWTRESANWNLQYIGLLGIALAAIILALLERTSRRFTLKEKRAGIAERWRAVGVASEFPFSSLYASAHIKESRKSSESDDREAAMRHWTEISAAVVDSVTRSSGTTDT